MHPSLPSSLIQCCQLVTLLEATSYFLNIKVCVFLHFQSLVYAERTSVVVKPCWDTVIFLGGNIPLNATNTNLERSARVQGFWF